MAPVSRKAPVVTPPVKSNSSSSGKNLSNTQKKEEETTKKVEQMVEKFLLRLVATMMLVGSLYSAYKIRLFAVITYGRVIHEFDPWFNFRATEYLVNNGVSKFFCWYDEASWYPIGRPIGSTIYPGLQLTAAAFHYIVNYFEGPLKGMSLNDVCVFIPAVFGVFTTFATFLLALEVSEDQFVAVTAAIFMAIVPAHLMRSVAGGFDNESIAVFAMVFTFYWWCRSVRTPDSWPFALAAALSYIYMVAAWGGYVFVVNLIAIHAFIVGLSTLSVSTTTAKNTDAGSKLKLKIKRKTLNSLHLAYSLFYVLGTLGATHIPVVGMIPLKSLEHMLPLGVFVFLQFIRLNSFLGAKKSATQLASQFLFLSLICGATSILVFAYATKIGYMGPLSARVRGLFLKHAKTGNPLVDSVAEHQYTRREMYGLYFHCVKDLVPVGLVLTVRKMNKATWFLILYTATTYYFSARMVRLLLLLAPPASILAAEAVVGTVKWCYLQLAGGGDFMPEDGFFVQSSNRVEEDDSKNKEEDEKVKSKVSKPIIDEELEHELKSLYNSAGTVRMIAACIVFWMLFSTAMSYLKHCMGMAGQLSNPAIMIKKRDTTTGQYFIVDDFRESYWWLRDNTAQDARVMAWWDYGYQISGIANRTTIADGNTWNHEHIALLGKALVSPLQEGHAIIRHLADYVLVWSTSYGGMYGDDVAKSPHMAKIAGSVYHDIKASEFYRTQQGMASDMMQASVIYNLVNFRLNASIPTSSFRIDPDSEELDEHLFREVFTSKNKMVRIYKVLKVSVPSKEFGKEGRGYQAWISGRNPSERGGSLYPPALESILNHKVDFKQLEDFNKVSPPPERSILPSPPGSCEEVGLDGENGACTNSQTNKESILEDLVEVDDHLNWYHEPVIADYEDEVDQAEDEAW